MEDHAFGGTLIEHSKDLGPGIADVDHEWKVVRPREVHLRWAADDHVVFMSYQDGWPHLYSVSASGGLPATPGLPIVSSTLPSGLNF